MPSWLGYAMIAIACWGAVGLFQKLGTNYTSPRELTIWLAAGFIVFVPFLLPSGDIADLEANTIMIGIAAGFVNGVGSWALFRALEQGAKASVAVPFTALYPLLTVLLAVSLLEEKPTAREWIGVLLALAAGAMLSYEPGSREESYKIGAS